MRKKKSHNPEEARTPNSYQRDFLLVLAAVAVLPYVYYGGRVLLVLGVSMLGAAAGTAVFRLLRGVQEIPDLSCLTTGMLIGLMLPVNVPLFIPALASLFAVCVVREPFGEKGTHLLNPAAGGLAFVTVLWPETVFSYYNMKAGTGVTLWDGVCAVISSPSAQLKNGFIPDLQPFDMLFGRYAGPMGATAAVVLAAGLVFLFARGDVDFRMPAGMLLGACLVAWLFPRIPASPLTSLKFEILAGGVLAVILLQAADSASLPATRAGKWTLGLVGGLLLMSMQYGGAYEQSGAFVVLLLGALAPLADQLTGQAGVWIQQRKQRKGGEPHGKKPHRKEKGSTETA